MTNLRSKTRQAADSLKAEVQCIEACADRLNTIADNNNGYKESLELISQTLRLSGKNALALWRLMEAEEVAGQPLLD